MQIDTTVHSKQGEALRLLSDDTTKFVLFGGGAGGGKSWLGCLWLILMCMQYPGSRWFIGREELKRLRGSTLQTFYKVAGSLGVTGEYKYNGQDHFLQFHNGSRIDLLELKYQPSDPLYERFGSMEFTGGFIEEGGEIHFGAFDVLKSRIGRQKNDEHDVLGVMLITANPKKNWLYRKIYKPWKNGTLAKEYAFVPSLVTDNPYRESGAVKALEDIESEITKQRLLYGNWEYEDDPEQLIRYEWVQRAEGVPAKKGAKKLGVDVARFGDDETVIIEIDGNAMASIDHWQGTDTFKTAQRVLVMSKDRVIDADKIGVDVVGLGAGVVDALTDQGMHVVEIISGAKPVEDPDSAYQFKNLRSQMWWAMRDALKNSELCLSGAPEKLIEDLTAPRYKISSDKTVEVESKDSIKKRIGRSTDYGDALVYANFVDRINLTDFYSFV